jgi:hypothetical protein
LYSILLSRTALRRRGSPARANGKRQRGRQDFPEATSPRPPWTGLRDFDLKTLLFRDPLSYTIYSAAFDALRGPVRDRIYQRLHDILAGQDQRPKLAALSPEDRRSILERIGP